MNIVDLIRRVPGVEPTLKDWLGDGGIPVSSRLAEQRANACVFGNGGTHCPKNVEPNWWDRHKNRIALAIREQLAVKHQLGMFVSKESEIGMCRQCGCCLKLKVWTPIGYVKEHLTDDEVETLPSFCWMKTEIESLAVVPPYEP